MRGSGITREFEWSRREAQIQRVPTKLRRTEPKAAGTAALQDASAVARARCARRFWSAAVSAVWASVSQAAIRDELSGRLHSADLSADGGKAAGTAALQDASVVARARCARRLWSAAVSAAL